MATPDPTFPETLQLALFEAVYERALEWIAGGDDFDDMIEEEAREIDTRAFLRWMRRDADRVRRWDEAHKDGCGPIERRLIRIAAGKDSVEDVQRSKLRVDTLRWLLGIWNKDRYAPAQKIDVGFNISITQALADARLRVIEGSSERMVEER